MFPFLPQRKKIRMLEACARNSISNFLSEGSLSSEERRHNSMSNKVFLLGPETPTHLQQLGPEASDSQLRTGPPGRLAFHWMATCVEERSLLGTAIYTHWVRSQQELGHHKEGA